MKRLSWIITVPLTAVVVIFALSNRQSATLDLWPLPFQPVLPTFLLVLVSLFAGFLLGSLIVWFSGSRRRRRNRELRRRTEQLSHEVARLSKQPAPANVSMGMATAEADANMPRAVGG